MEYLLVLGAMIAVLTGLFALLLTSPQSVQAEKPAQRKAAVAMWLRILMVGWVFFLLVPIAVPGGLDGAWAWIGSQSVALQGAMWVFMLPWMLAVGVWQLALPAVVRIAAMVGIAVLTLYLGSKLIGSEQE